MTGEQKPGGLEVVAWLETHRHTGEIRVALKRRADSPIMVSRWATIPLTPAEPAEARIRSLEAELAQANANGASHWGRATAAEAKLARAVEGLPDLFSVIAWLDNGCDPKHAADELRIHKARIDQTLAALQQARVLDDEQARELFDRIAGAINAARAAHTGEGTDA